MKDLISKLEAAPKGSRELDRAIGKAIGRTETAFQQYEPDGAMPRFTTSLDAALSFLPEGWSYEIWGKTPYFSGGARINQWHGRSTWRTFVAHNDSPILALCIVALKAWEAER